MKPYFSVIIPTLNEERFLPRLLRQLRNQTDRDFEVIVVDGNSEDQTKKICLQEYSYNLRFYQTKKRNVAYQRNYGAQKAQGSFLVFLDADTGIYKTFINKLKKTITKRPGLVYIPYVLPGEHDQQSKLIFLFVNGIVEFSQNLTKPLSTGGSMIWEKHFFSLLGGFDETLFLAEDHNIIQKASKWGVKAHFLQDVKITFSLRRMKREGQLRLFYKNILATAYVFIKGDIREKLFDYQMGGGIYKILKSGDETKPNLNNYLLQVKKFFRKYLI